MPAESATKFVSSVADSQHWRQLVPDAAFHCTNVYSSVGQAASTAHARHAAMVFPLAAGAIKVQDCRRCQPAIRPASNLFLGIIFPQPPGITLPLHQVTAAAQLGRTSCYLARQSLHGRIMNPSLHPPKSNEQSGGVSAAALQLAVVAAAGCLRPWLIQTYGPKRVPAVHVSVAMWLID